MKSFRFKQFEVKQSKEVFRVGTDAVLLGALVDVGKVNSVLEVGVGTGIVSLMMAQRNNEASFTGVEINPKAFELSKENFSSSPFSKRMNVVLEDFNSCQSETSFDLIVSNPPYFDENSSSKDTVARQKLKLNFEQLIVNSAKLLSKQGALSLIVPSEFEEEITCLSKKENLFLSKKIMIKGIEGGKVKRLVLTFSKEEASCLLEEFIIEKSPRKYSDQYLELTKEFHVFSK